MLDYTWYMCRDTQDYSPKFSVMNASCVSVQKDQHF